MRYILYARKSRKNSELTALHQLAAAEGLAIAIAICESRPARYGPNRPTLARIVRLIEEGQADGILCRRIDVLSRHPIDYVTLDRLVNRGSLRSVRTMEEEWVRSDTGLAFAILADRIRRAGRGELIRRGLLFKHFNPGAGLCK